jgi:hypothetical protein
LVKDIPSIGRFYRFIFKTAKYCVTIFVNNQGLMKLNGIQAIPNYFDALVNRRYNAYG